MVKLRILSPQKITKKCHIGNNGNVGPAGPAGPAPPPAPPAPLMSAPLLLFL